MTERVNCLEKEMIIVKNDLTGERSIWATLEGFVLSVDAFRKSSEMDRKEIRELINAQSVESMKMGTAYLGMAGILKALGVAIIAAIIGILVGLLTHTIQIGG
jgi:hypothetical protein